MLAEFLGLSRSLENPGVPVDQAVWGSTESASGEDISPLRALNLAPVWQSVSMISGDIAKLPLNLYERLDEDTRQRAVNIPMQKVVRRQPNREIGSIKFWRRFVSHALLWGNAYAWIDRNGRGEAAGLINLLPDRTYPRRRNGVLTYTTTVSDEGRAVTETLPASEVVHVEGLTINNIKGEDLVAAARDSFGLALAAEGFGSKFFANGAQAGGVLEIPTHYTQQAADNLEEGWRQKYTSRNNWFRTAILRDGAKFHSVTVDAQSSQLTELREEQVREVARWFNLAPSRLGLSDSVSYNSKAEDNQSYLDSTLSIYMELIQEELWIKTLTPKQQLNHYFEYNTNALLRMNANDRMEYYKDGLGWGLWTPNEVRARENMNPRDGGDVYFAPLNHFVSGPDAGQYLNPNDAPSVDTIEDPATTDGRLPPPSESGTLHRVRQVVFGIGASGRTKARKPNQFCKWIDSDLIYHRQQFRKLLGEDANAESLIFDSVVNQLNESLDSTQPEDLASVADEILTQLENRAEFIAEEIDK